MKPTTLKATVLRQVEPGRRAKLADGRLLRVSALIQGDVFVREILEEDYQWLPGRFGDRESELFIERGDASVVEVRL